MRSVGVLFTLWGTLGAVANKLRLLVRLGARMFARVVLLALPFLAIIALVWFTTLAGRDVNYYLSEHPPEWRRALLAAGIAGAGLGSSCCWRSSHAGS